MIYNHCAAPAWPARLASVSTRDCGIIGGRCLAQLALLKVNQYRDFAGGNLKDSLAENQAASSSSTPPTPDVTRAHHDHAAAAIEAGFALIAILIAIYFFRTLSVHAGPIPQWHSCSVQGNLSHGQGHRECSASTRFSCHSLGPGYNRFIKTLKNKLSHWEDSLGLVIVSLGLFVMDIIYIGFLHDHMKFCLQFAWLCGAQLASLWTLLVNSLGLRGTDQLLVFESWWILAPSWPLRSHFEEVLLSEFLHSIINA